jgi:hypothetical protein
MRHFRNYIIGFLAVCALWGQVMSCNRGLNYKRVDRELSLEQMFNSNLRSSYNAKIGRVEYEREMLVADKKQLESFLKSKDKELYELRKRTKAQAGGITTTVLVRDTVTTYDTVYVDDSKRDIRVARIQDEYLDIGIISRPDSLILNPFIVKDSVEFAVKDGVLSILHHNPHVHVSGIKSFKIEQPKQNTKWKFWAGLAAGAVGGYFIFK